MASTGDPGFKLSSVTLSQLQKAPLALQTAALRPDTLYEQESPESPPCSGQHWFPAGRNTFWNHSGTGAAEVSSGRNLHPLCKPLTFIRGNGSSSVTSINPGISWGEEIRQQTYQTPHAFLWGGIHNISTIPRSSYERPHTQHINHPTLRPPQEVPSAQTGAKDSQLPV